MHRLLALTLLLLLTCSAASQRDVQEPKLAVTLRSLNSTYRTDEKIQLEIQLSNVGTTDFLISRRLDWGVGRTDIRVFDAVGKEVFTDVLADSVPAMPESKDFFDLGPNQFFGVRVVEPVANFVNTPGTYVLVVDYTYPLPEKWVRENLQLPRIPVWARERGTSESNRIKIVVTK